MFTGALSQQQQQQQSWTAQTYRTRLLAQLVSSVQDEVRRQQDAHDHALEVLEARACGAGEPEGGLGFWLARSATPEEQTTALHEHFPLGTLHTNALVALGRYKLMQRLQAHLTRLEDERRAVAVAAGDGTGGAPLPLPSGTPRAEAGPSTTQSTPVKANTAHHDDDNGQTSIDTLAVVSPSRARPVKVECGTGGTTARLSQPLPTQAKTELDGDVGSGTNMNHHHHWPTWRPVLTQEEPTARSGAPRPAWNGAYFVPHSMSSGAPLPRYLSSDRHQSATLSAAPSVSTPPSAAAAAAVVATRMPTLVVPAAVLGSRSLLQNSAAPAAPLTRVRGRNRDEPSGLVRTLRTRMGRSGRLENHVRLIGPAANGVEKDRVMRLWWKLWPRHPEGSPVGTSSATPAAETVSRPLSRALPPHTTVRPTLAMVTALIQLTEMNYKRDRARCAALESCIAAISSAGSGGSVKMASLPPQVRFLLDSGDTEGAGGGTGGVVAEKQVHQLRKSLARRQAALDTACQARMTLLGELTDALDEAPRVLGRHRGSEGERGDQRKTPCSGVGEKAPSVKRPRGEGGATAPQPEHTTALTLLRRALTTPHFLLQLEGRLQQSLRWFTADPTAAAEVPSKQEELVAAAHTWELPNDITGVRLPPSEEDSTDPGVAAGLWPVELDASIRHELRAVVMEGRPRTPNSVALHVSISADEVRRLEAAAEAGELSAQGAAWMEVSTLLSSRVMAHPIKVARGWLYVHGRGEVVVANVELR